MFQERGAYSAKCVDVLSVMTSLRSFVNRPGALLTSYAWGRRNRGGAVVADAVVSIRVVTWDQIQSWCVLTEWFFVAGSSTGAARSRRESGQCRRNDKAAAAVRSLVENGGVTELPYQAVVPLAVGV